MNTRLVIVNIDENIGLLSQPERFCSRLRLGVSAGIAHPHRRLQGLAAELALSYALSGDELRPPEYSYDEKGRPVIGNGYISLSHSGYIAVCAYSDVPVGVDAELIRELDGRIARRVLSPAELEAFAVEGNRYLIDRFVMKEAGLKMTGEGISSGLSRIFETGGGVFRGGVRIGFARSIPIEGYSCFVVTAQERAADVLMPRFNELQN